jgi:xanthine/CO dehydrogenase XdhC/CoxF family maturation factor
VANEQRQGHHFFTGDVEDIEAALHRHHGVFEYRASHRPAAAVGRRCGGAVRVAAEKIGPGRPPAGRRSARQPSIQEEDQQDCLAMAVSASDQQPGQGGAIPQGIDRHGFHIGIVIDRRQRLPPGLGIGDGIQEHRDR